MYYVCDHVPKLYVGIRNIPRESYPDPECKFILNYNIASMLCCVYTNIRMNCGRSL